MKNLHYLWHFFWLLPAYIGFLAIHQGTVYFGIEKTYNEGKTYLADVIDFDIKQIAAQTNGYITVEFETESGKFIQRQLSQPIQNAAQLQDAQTLPIYYLEDSSQQIVIIPIYEFHRNMVMANFVMLLFALAITVWLGFLASRFAFRKTAEQEGEPRFEIVDS